MQTPSAAQPLTIYFFYQTGCEACEEAEPELEKFKKKNEIWVIKRNAALTPAIKATPQYMLSTGTEVIGIYVGVMNSKQIAKWIADAIEARGDDES